MGADVAWTGHHILEEVTRPVAGIGVIGLRRLVKRVADPHPGPADQLLLDQAGIERPAQFVSAVHFDPHRHFAHGLVVDF